MWTGVLSLVYRSAKIAKNLDELWARAAFFDAVLVGGNPGARLFLLFSERLRQGEKWQTSCNPMRGGAL